MKKEVVSATLGIDVETASSFELLRRATELCCEMSECYEVGTLEHDTFFALFDALCTSQLRYLKNIRGEDHNAT